jgi:hypothetical protein
MSVRNGSWTTLEDGIYLDRDHNLVIVESELLAGMGYKGQRLSDGDWDAIVSAVLENLFPGQPHEVETVRVCTEEDEDRGYLMDPVLKRIMASMEGQR